MDCKLLPMNCLDFEFKLRRLDSVEVFKGLRSHRFRLLDPRPVIVKLKNVANWAEFWSGVGDHWYRKCRKYSVFYYVIMTKSKPIQAPIHLAVQTFPKNIKSAC